MKKLKNKILIVLVTIMTIFSLTVLAVYNYQNYNRELEPIKNSLNTMDRGTNFNGPNNRIFMDIIIYTVYLEDDDIVIVNHSNQSISKNEVIKVVNKIISKNKTKEIGNLYFSNYSYVYKSNSEIIIVDQSLKRAQVLTTLNFSIGLFIIIEILIVLIANAIAESITKPVEESFIKQQDFIADASHELKTPLAIIMASSDEIVVTKKNEKLLDNIKNESEKMKKLINKLLELARIENEDLSETFTITNLSKLVEKESLTFDTLAFDKKVTIENNITDNINYKCNPDEIKEVVAIIIDNAIKHSTKESIINVDLVEEKNNIILTVKNKGEGIPKGDEEKIFERFYRAAKDRNREENRYGLGLGIAKSIIDNHNGTISANSKDGFTTFKIILKK